MSLERCCGKHTLLLPLLLLEFSRLPHPVRRSGLFWGRLLKTNVGKIHSLSWLIKLLLLLVDLVQLQYNCEMSLNMKNKPIGMKQIVPNFQFAYSHLTSMASFHVLIYIIYIYITAAHIETVAQDVDTRHTHHSGWRKMEDPVRQDKTGCLASLCLLCVSLDLFLPPVEVTESYTQDPLNRC